MGPRRRAPISRVRYRAIARGAGARRGPFRPRWIDAALVGALAIVLLIAVPRAAAAVGAGFEQVITSIQSAIPQLQLTGKVPSFAVQAGRSLQIVLNGAVVATTPLDPSGAFSTALALRDGANTVGVALVADRDVVAASTYTVVLDRTPPTLKIAQPAAGSTVDAKNVVVSGTAEVSSTITVNGRTVVPAADGTFTDSFNATP